MKTAPANPGGTQTPYTGLKIYQSPAPADDASDSDSVPPAPTPAGKAAQNAAPAISPSLAPVIRPSTPPVETAPKVAATPTPAPTKLVQTAPAKPAPVAAPIETPALTENRVATKPPASLSAAVPAPKPHITKIPATDAPTPPPAETTETKPAAATSGGGYLLQIGAYKSEDEATAAWHAYQAKHPVVGGYESDIKKVDLGDKGTWYRLRVGSFGDKTSANALCDKLKADGGSCFLAK